MAAHQQMLLGATPAPGGAAPEWVDNTGAVYSGAATTHTLPLDDLATRAVDDFLVLLKTNWVLPTSVDTDDAQELAALAVFPGLGGNVGQIFGGVLTGSVPDDVIVELGESADFSYALALARGVSAVGATEDAGFVGDVAVTEIPYVATATNSLIAMVIGHGSGIDITSATFNGGAGIVIQDLANNATIILGVHSGSTGANVVELVTSAAMDFPSHINVELVT